MDPRMDEKLGTPSEEEMASIRDISGALFDKLPGEFTAAALSNLFGYIAYMIARNSNMSREALVEIMMRAIKLALINLEASGGDDEEAPNTKLH